MVSKQLEIFTQFLFVWQKWNILHKNILIEKKNRQEADYHMHLGIIFKNSESVPLYTLYLSLNGILRCTVYLGMVLLILTKKQVYKVKEKFLEEHKGINKP